MTVPRILRLDFSWETPPISVVCVPLPAPRSIASTSLLIACCQFYPSIATSFCSSEGRGLQLCKDHPPPRASLNCLASDLDVTPNALGSSRVGYTGGLQLVKETHEPHDAWRELHPGLRGNTQPVHPTCPAAWLLSSALLPSLGRAKEGEGPPGDHQAVAIRLVSSVGAAKGPGGWVFPLALLDEVRSFITSFLETIPVTDACTHGQRWDLKRPETTLPCLLYEQ